MHLLWQILTEFHFTQLLFFLQLMATAWHQETAYVMRAIVAPSVRLTMMCVAINSHVKMTGHVPTMDLVTILATAQLGSLELTIYMSKILMSVATTFVKMEPLT